MSNEKIKVGVFSPNDNREWVISDNIDLMLKNEKLLIDALRNEGIEVIRGGEGFSKKDQIAWNRELVIKHSEKIAEEKPDAIILNQSSWTFPRDSIDAIDIYENKLKEILKVNHKISSRILLYGYKDTTVPGLVAVMAIAGALKTIGKSYQISYGKIDKDPNVLKDILKILRFYKKRSDSEELVNNVINLLPKQKYLQFGGESLRMPTATADPNLWQKIFKVSYDHLDQSEIIERALNMVEWTGKPSESDFKIKDCRVEKALNYKKKYGKFDLSREKLQYLNKFLMQLSLYYATYDIIKEKNATFCGIKCQDELSAKICTACLATSYLGNDVGPAGENKDIIPTSCENDMDTSLTQLILHLLSEKPSGFGDFRDIEKDLLAVVNCGQHPPYFFGKCNEESKQKELRSEFLGQEVFYDAGGSSVRGRTPGGELITVARLGRENFKYYLAATIVKTVEVSMEEHKRYNFSWPIIKGKLPINEEKMINLWPSNHLAFSYGDFTPHLVELSEKLGIGYKIFDSNGIEYLKTV